jgi:hypothetical protein
LNLRYLIYIIFLFISCSCVVIVFINIFVGHISCDIVLHKEGVQSDVSEIPPTFFSPDSFPYYFFLTIPLNG